MQNKDNVRDFACQFVWVCNLVSHTTDRIQADGGLRLGCWGRYFQLIWPMGEWGKLH